MTKSLMLDLRNALIPAARVVSDNFGKSVQELGTEYKPQMVTLQEQL